MRNKLKLNKVSLWSVSLYERFIKIKLNRCHGKSVIGFQYSLVTQMADRSQTSTGVSLYVYGELHKVLTLPATLLLAKNISVMSL